MAVTISITDRNKNAQKKIVYGTIVLDSSYPTGGESAPQTVLGLGEIDHIDFTNENGYVAQYDYTNEKVKMYASAGTEVSNGTDLSAITLMYRAEGK